MMAIMSRWDMDQSGFCPFLDHNTSCVGSESAQERAGGFDQVARVATGE